MTNALGIVPMDFTVLKAVNLFANKNALPQEILCSTVKMDTSTRVMMVIRRLYMEVRRHVQAVSLVLIDSGASVESD